jgi:hypothetical protein
MGASLHSGHLAETNFYLRQVWDILMMCSIQGGFAREVSRVYIMATVGILKSVGVLHVYFSMYIFSFSVRIWATLSH